MAMSVDACMCIKMYIKNSNQETNKKIHSA